MSSLERDRIPLARPIPVKEVPLVDRTEEMTVLKEAVYKAAHDEGSLVFVYGEAGIGKTRLLRELGAYAQSRGVQVLHGRCPGLFRMDGVPPYVIWKEVIKDYLETCTPEQLYRVVGYYPAEIAKLVPEISQKLRTIPQSFSISPEQEQNRLFEAVSQLITNLSQETPLLVILDDLQWTDPSSLLLLHYLARGVLKTQLLLLGAYRSTDVDAKHPLTPVLTELNRERLPQSVSLKRMSLNDISEMIRNILEQDDVPLEFCRMVYEKTRGNPFFAEEVIKSLKEEEVIYREKNKWKIKEVSKIEFPETVKSVTNARIGRLDGECQKVLTTASLIGNDFTLNVLQEIIGLDEGSLRKILDRLLKTELLKHRAVRGESVCSFADVIVRDVVYEDVGAFERQQLHSVVGAALEKVYAGKIDEHLGELAYHFLEAGDKDKALGYFLKAGEKTSKIYANSEAVSYFQSALGLLEEKKDEIRERAHILEKLGDIKELVGENDACMNYWNEALLLWTKIQEKEKTATLHRKMANVLWGKMADKNKAKEHHEAALRILESEPESVELARLYENVAHMLLRIGEVTKARPLAEKALVLAEKLNALEVVADSLLDLALEAGWTGNFKKGLEYASRALKIALDNSYLETAVWAYERVAEWLPEEEYEKRLEHWEKGLALTKKIGDISRNSFFLYGLAGEYWWQGELNKSITLTEEALTLAKKTGDLIFIPWNLQQLGDAYRILGEWDKSEQYYEEAADASRGQNEFQTVAASHASFGLLYFDREEYARAKESLEEALKVLKTTENRAWQMGFSQPLICASIELGELDKAQGMLDSLQKFTHETGSKGYILGEMALRAMLFRAQKKYAESLELFEKTLKEWESIKANVWRAYYFARWVLCEYARVYLERNRPGDKEKARDLLNRALGMFQKMGAKKDIEKTIKLMDGLQLASQVQTGEKTVTPAGYICEEVQGSIIASPKELKVGESLELEIEITNVRKEGTILLTKITEAIPEGFAVVKKPEQSRVEGDCLNIRDKKLEPSKTEVVKLVLTPKIQGTFHLKPKIVYLDENGKEKTCEPKPISVTVKELGLKGWLKGER